LLLCLLSVKASLSGEEEERLTKEGTKEEEKEGLEGELKDCKD
jgi:hypothetical protein